MQDVVALVAAVAVDVGPGRPEDAALPLAAAALVADQRRAFANDPAKLIATTRSENSAKGDSTAEDWVPSDPSYGCSYATVVVTVKQRFSLSVTAEEAAALDSLLATC